MSTEELREIMDSLEISNEKQAKYAKGQLLLSIAAALLCLVALITVLLVIPQLRQTAQQFNEVSEQAIELAEQAEGLMDELDTSVQNLEIISTQLAESDLESMVNNVNDLAVSSQTELADAMEKLNKIDFEELNSAISNLSAVVEPLAKFFNVFN